MPLSGGTAGAHDDAMHQGSAKKDVSGGVAGINASGHLLAVAHRIYLRLGGANQVSIWDRTNVERIVRWVRNGAGDFEGRIMVSGVEQKIQVSTDKDVVNGIAALDAGGAVLAPGSEVKLTRDGSNNIELVERTSAEIVARWTRTGVNDYQAYIHCGGLVCQFQHSGMKDIAGGIAGLDANVLLPLALLPACLEEYINHLGAVDNFTETAVGGAGTATPDAANHEMDLVGPSGNVGSAIMRTKSQYTFGSQILVGSFLIQNIGVSDGAGRNFEIGFSNGFATGGAAQAALVYYDGTNWYRKNANGLPGENAIISDISSGDTITIVATSSILRFFVNGVSIATTATNIPTGAMNCGVAVDRRVGAGATNLTASVDMMSLRRYL